MGWCHLVFESFCLYRSSKDKTTEFFEIVCGDDGELLHDDEGGLVTKSTGVVDNPSYIDAERPQFCKDKFSDKEIDEGKSDMTPHPDCWMNDCKFLATCPLHHKEMKTMVKAWEKASSQGKFDDLDSDMSDDGGDMYSSSFPTNKDD